MSDDDEDDTDSSGFSESAADSEEDTLGARTPAVGSRPGSTSDPLPEYWGIRTLPPTICAPDDADPYECAVCEDTVTARPEREELALWCDTCGDFRVFNHIDTE